MTSNLREILNVSVGTQVGKTTYTLRETENCIEYVNINLVFEYNIVVEDVIAKGKDFSISIDKIDKKKLRKYRSELVDKLDPDFPDMLVGIMDVHRAELLEGFLLWCKHRNIPVRIIIDEYDIFAVGHKIRDAAKQRDEFLQMVRAQGLASMIEYNSATNIAGLISDIDWKDVNIIKPYPGYCGWDSLQIQDLSESHFQDLLNGYVTAEMKRKLARAYESQENVLMNLHSRTNAHENIATALDGLYTNIKTINYASDDTMEDMPSKNTLIVGGNKFGRSVTIPNLTTMFYYRKNVPVMANMLQAVGRVLGNRPMDPTVITTPLLKKSIEHSWKLEKLIVEDEILLLPQDDRIRWLNDKIKNIDCVKVLPIKSNGYAQTKTAKYMVSNDVEGFLKFDHWYEIDMPQDLWDDWEIKPDNRRTSQAMLKLCEQAYPYIKNIEGVRDEKDGVNAARRRYIAVKENLENGYNRYVNRKGSSRKLPILYGRQRGKPGKGFLIVRDKDIKEYSANCWHHNEYGEKVRLVQTLIQRNLST